jgi:DNA-binding NarL/FixJ family response regulator
MPIKDNGRITEKPTISILIVDEDNLARKGLRKMLLDLNWFNEISECSIDQRIEEKYDVILISEQIKTTEIIEKVRTTYPTQKIVPLLLSANNEVITKLLSLEVNGIVLRTSPFEELINCIQVVADGRDFYSPEISTMYYQLWVNEKSQKLKNEQNLSNREKEVLKAICDQKTNDEIAEDLFLSPSSVKKYRCTLLEKTKSRTSAGLIIYAVKHGIYII